jgi:hypothetical protein
MLLAAFLAGAWFLLQGNVGLNIKDEGYLWHDIQRTYEGGVPILDFRSYDPGRYYWGALWFHVLGPGFASLQIALSVFQMIGLFFGLLAVRRVISSTWLLIPAAILLLLWMYPRHKYFEHSLIMAAVFAAVCLIEKPTVSRHMCVGVFIGIAAFFGRHLGVYFVAGFLFLIGFIGIRERRSDLVQKYAAWGAGIAIGYLPMILMLLFIPGLPSAFLDSILRLFGPYAPVKSLPIPWPWATPLSGLSWPVAWRSLILVLLWAYYLAGALIILFSKRDTLRLNPLWVASFFIGLPLMHYILERANFIHLALGIHPLLIGLIAITAHAVRNRRYVLSASMAPVLIGLLTLVLMQAPNLLMTRENMNRIAGRDTDLVACDLNGDTVWMHPDRARTINAVTHFMATNMAPDESILIAPYDSGLYPILHRNSPIWDPYPIHDAPPEEQQQSIDDLRRKNVRWAIVSDSRLDGAMEERRFSRTHPLLWEYLTNNFDRVAYPQYELGPDRRILKRKTDRL